MDFIDSVHIFIPETRGTTVIRPQSLRSSQHHLPSVRLKTPLPPKKKPPKTKKQGPGLILLSYCKCISKVSFTYCLGRNLCLLLHRSPIYDLML